MGFLSDLLGRTTPVQSTPQPEGNNMMLKALQDRLAASTCPTERASLQNNINAIQRAMQQNQNNGQINPNLPPQNSVPNPQIPQVPKINLQPLEQELYNLKNSIGRIENILMALKAQ